MSFQPAMREGSDSSTEEDDWVEEEDMFVPATAIGQASCSTEQKAQTSSSQPSTSVQTPSQRQNDYGTYINLINEISDEDDDDDLYSAVIASIEDET